MMQNIWTMLAERRGFFAKLLLEHLEISLVAILTALIFGGIAGILHSSGRARRGNLPGHHYEQCGQDRGEGNKEEQGL